MKSLRFIAILLFPFLFFCQEKDNTNYDLLIQNATIVDGTGAKPYSGHVLILDDRIAKIEKNTNREFTANDTVDASGMVLTPGFIDTHAHGNPLKTPEFKNFIAQGVTTISLGQDGHSPQEEDLSNWMREVKAVKPAVNIAMFVGHNTLRQLSGIDYDSLPDESRLEKMDSLLQNAMNAGCFGMTTGLEYNPGNFSKTEELNRLAKTVGKNNGMIMSHMRNEDDDAVENSIRELLQQGKYCPVHVSHIKSVYGKGKQRAKELLQLLDSARTEDIKVTADIYPYTASHTGIAILFPDWAKRPHDYQEVVQNRREELEEFLHRKVVQRNGPESTLIGTGQFTGKNLAEISEELNKSFEDVLIEDIGPYGAGAAHFIMDDELQETLLASSYINVCSDGSPTMHHPRGYGSFAKIIETYVENQDLFSIEEAVHKMTGLAAKAIGLDDRGEIREGYKADILLFNPSEVKETATYEEPHQLARGMQYVFVNGKAAKQAERFSYERNGKVLKKNR